MIRRSSARLALLSSRTPSTRSGSSSPPPDTKRTLKRSENNEHEVKSTSLRLKRESKVQQNADEKAKDIWPAELEDARKHLQKVDSRLDATMKRFGAPRCSWVKESEAIRSSPHALYHSMLKSITHQQLAGPAAKAIWNRLLESMSSETATPDAVMALSTEKLRSIGFSARKVDYIRSVSEYARTGAMHMDVLESLSDKEIIDRLTKLRGIGRWSVNMLLMFALKRRDVLACGDLSIRKGFAVHFGFKELPTPDQMETAAEPWRPYRSIACLYMYSLSPQFKKTKGSSKKRSRKQ